LKTLLATKENVILQGAPGVGKTFAAKRLAFSIMGEKDVERVQTTQFHQSYSYEDFVMGFRPTATGFELRKGVFYEFCRKAAEDDRPYFFIIDEINRGNLSKIFGELFMLIENDKRGVELRLLYADERFAIPSNVHIIGAMNTADRSLALIDYALRRRFAFFELEPAFDSEGFRAFQRRVGNAKFDSLIEVVKSLNVEIAADETLGAGFCVGHSYFCAKTNVDDLWLKSVVEFELIPLLKEYWFDESAKAGRWSAALREAIR
jgi:5-methylcytosine-specific restriction protein B